MEFLQSSYLKVASASPDGGKASLPHKISSWIFKPRILVEVSMMMIYEIEKRKPGKSCGSPRFFDFFRSLVVRDWNCSGE